MKLLKKKLFLIYWLNKNAINWHYWISKVYVVPILNAQYRKEENIWLNIIKKTTTKNNKLSNC